jgi:hypothetical protein
MVEGPALVVVTALVVASCGGHGGDDGHGADSCADLDGDGFGQGAACLGPDCEEDDATRHECPDCDLDPESTGCPCIGTGVPHACYEGPEGTAGHAPCAAGLRECRDRVWSACEGQTLPEPETCDAEDDDCDGVVDDGARNDCGNCDEECSPLVLGAAGEPWDAGEGSQGIAVEGGALTLDRPEPRRPYIWLMTEGVPPRVWKVDTAEREILGEYLVHPQDALGDTRALDVSTNVGVDAVVLGSHLELSAWVPPYFVTRVNSEDCPEGSTSSGRGDVLAFGEDACVAWSAELSMETEAHDVLFEPRPVLDGFEDYVWISGLISGAPSMIELSGDGEVTGRQVDLDPGASDFDDTAVLSPDGKIWVGYDDDGWLHLAQVDPAEAEVVGIFEDRDRYLISHFGMWPDEHGRIWFHGDSGASSGGSIFDPVTEEYDDFELNGSPGVTVGRDYAWFGGSYGTAYRVARDDLTVEEFQVGGLDDHGWLFAVDVDGSVWAVSSGSMGVAVFPQVDPDSYAVLFEADEFQGSRGDWTGAQAANLVDLVGTYRHVFEGCDADRPTTWATLEWDADTPSESLVRFEMRTADTLEHLALAAWVAVAVAPTDGSPVDLAPLLAALVEPQNFLELRVTLDGGPYKEPPTLRQVTVRRSCGAGPA